MTLRLGNTLIAGASIPDTNTISYNSNGELQATGVIEKNAGNVKYDWVGTQAEYTVQNVATLHPEWVCYITDDETPSNFANTDLSNLTATGKSTVAEQSLPSDIYISLTLQASGADYTATANGWIQADGVAARNGGNITVQNKTSGLTINSSTGLSNGWGLNACCPVKSGDVYTVYYNDSTVSSLKFVYIEGEI